VAPRRHLTLQVLLSALAVAGALLGLNNRPDVDLTAGTPVQHLTALQVIESLQPPSKATRDLYATACGLPTRYCVLRSSSRPAELAEDLVDMLLDKGARRVDGHCPRGRQVEAMECHQRLELNGVGLLVTAGDEVGVGTRVPTFAALHVVGDEVLLEQRAAPLASLKLLGLVPDGFGSASCVQKRGAGCAEYRGVYSTPGALRGVAQVWRVRFASLGYRPDADSCARRTCLLAASRFRSFAGQDAMSVVVNLSDAGDGRVVQRLLVTVPEAPVTAP
jgi:hypothetical protein